MPTRPSIRSAWTRSWLALAENGLTDVEALPVQAVDVVGQADHEEHQHQQEADALARSITLNGTRSPADLLDQAPEDVTAVERAGTGRG